jgi:hypothetical protein
MIIQDRTTVNYHNRDCNIVSEVSKDVPRFKSYIGDQFYDKDNGRIFWKKATTLAQERLNYLMYRRLK